MKYLFVDHVTVKQYTRNLMKCAFMNANKL